MRLYGAPAEEITVILDAGELTALGLSAPEVSARVAAADAKQPAGVLRTPSHDVLMEVAGELDSVQRVMSIPLARNA